MKLNAFFIVVFCCLNAGCSSDLGTIRKYQRLLTEDQPELKDAAPEIKQSVIQSILDKEVWDLTDCFDLALQYNERLKIAGEDYIQAMDRKREALSAILPKITARASYFRQDGAAEFGSLQERRDQRLIVEQPIFSGFREFNAFRQSNQNIFSKESSLRYEKSRILSLVSEAFYQVLKWESHFKTLYLMRDIQIERLRQVKERYQLGVVRKTEVLSVKIDLADIEAQTRDAEGQHLVSRIQLAVFIGHPVQRSLKDKIGFSKTGDLSVLLQEARKNREDLRALEHTANSIKEEIGIAKGKYLPVVTFLGNYYLHRDGSQESIDWDVSVNAELSIFDGDAIRTEIQNAQSRYRQALLILEEQQGAVEEEVSTAYYLYQSAWDRAKVNQKRVRLAEENYQLIQEEYRQGLSSHLDVQLRYHDLVDARLNYDSVKWDRQSAYVKLLFTMGKLKLGES